MSDGATHSMHVRGGVLVSQIVQDPEALQKRHAFEHYIHVFPAIFHYRQLGL